MLKFTGKSQGQEQRLPQKEFALTADLVTNLQEGNQCAGRDPGRGLCPRQPGPGAALWQGGPGTLQGKPETGSNKRRSMPGDGAGATLTAGGEQSKGCQWPCREQVQRRAVENETPKTTISSKCQPGTWRTNIRKTYSQNDTLKNISPILN